MDDNVSSIFGKGLLRVESGFNRKASSAEHRGATHDRRIDGDGKAFDRVFLNYQGHLSQSPQKKINTALSAWLAKRGGCIDQFGVRKGIISLQDAIET